MRFVFDDGVVSGQQGRRGRSRTHLQAQGTAFSQQFADLSLTNQPAFVDNGDPVANLLHLAQHMARQENRFASFINQVTDKGADFLDTGRIQPIGRLVQNNQLRVMQQGRGDAQPLAHTGGIAGYLTVRPVRHRYLFQQSLDLGSIIMPLGPGQDFQVTPAGQVVIKNGPLDQGADLIGQDSGLVLDRPVKQLHLSRRWPD